MAAGLPERIDYVQQVVAHLHQGCFAPRTDKNMEASHGEVILPVSAREPSEDGTFELIVPDVTGEIWKRAVETNEVAPEWMEKLGTAVGAIVFVRILSRLNVDPIDWVTAAGLMRHQGDAAQPDKIPTQVMLCELLRFLEAKLHGGPNGQTPRVAVVVTAWDLLDSERSVAGPLSYLQKEYPLFAGRLTDVDELDVMIFGMSVLGGDLTKDSAFRAELLASDVESAGYVLFDEDGIAPAPQPVNRVVSHLGAPEPCCPSIGGAAYGWIPARLGESSTSAGMTVVQMSR